MSWTIVPATAFSLHAERWCTLHAATVGSPLLAVEFVSSLLTTFASGKEVLAWHIRDGHIDAMAVLTPSRLGIWNTFQPSQAPVGIWLQAGSDATSALLPGLLQALPFPALAVGLTQCDPMLMPRPPESLTTRVFDYIDTARITMSEYDGFASYWAERGKNLRNNLKKQRRGLTDEGVATRLEILRTPAAMSNAIAQYGLLESNGWKGANNTAVNADNNQGRFYATMLQAFAERGAASVYIYRIDTKIAAMDLCIEGNNCVVVLKTAYDEQLPKHLSPALLMREEACRQLFEEHRFKRIEFYGRVMDWHLKWTDEVRTMYHLTAYRTPMLATFHKWLNSRGQRV
jgi:hypothetical protein